MRIPKRTVWDAVYITNASVPLPRGRIGKFTQSFWMKNLLEISNIWYSTWAPTTLLTRRLIAMSKKIVAAGISLWRVEKRHHSHFVHMSRLRRARFLQDTLHQPTRNNLMLRYYSILHTAQHKTDSCPPLGWNTWNLFLVSAKLDFENDLSSQSVAICLCRQLSLMWIVSDKQQAVHRCWSSS